MKKIPFISSVFKRDEPSAEQIEYEEIRKELLSVRQSLFLLERLTNNTDSDFQEGLAQEINAKREMEHALIKRAKAIMQVPIQIPTSLREHKETLVPTTH